VAVASLHVQRSQVYAYIAAYRPPGQLGNFVLIRPIFSLSLSLSVCVCVCVRSAICTDAQELEVTGTNTCIV
jgi:hypothetical protein